MILSGGTNMTVQAIRKTSKKNPTPTDLDISPRHAHFDVEDELSTLWHSNDAFITAFFNALSIQFPEGEKQFINSVRQFKKQVNDKTLQVHMRNFIKQEGQHTREHRKYNDALEQRGYDLTILEKGINQQVALVKTLSKQRQLAGTCAAEHITAILAEGMLKHPEWLEGASPKMKALWKWHAVEETEHKGVAFDVFQSQVGNEKMRKVVMFVVLMNISRLTFINMCHMLKVDGQLYKPKTWINGTKFFWRKNGIIRHSIPELFKYFSKDFHPWEYDSRQLINQWEQEYDGSFKQAVN